MKNNFTRIEITSVLLSNEFKPIVQKDVSETYDVYEKKGRPIVKLPKSLKVFQRSQLKTILPSDLFDQL
jgi:hypothetical protein